MTKNHENAPIVVVGAGIIGLLCAWYLTENRRAVVLLDRQRLGRESSWAGGGILSPLYPQRYPLLHPLVRHSAYLYPSLAREITSVSSIDPELIASGLLVLDSPAPVTAAQQEATAAHAEAEWITSAKLRDVEPNLVYPKGVVRYRGVSQIRAPRLIRSLQEALSKHGVKLREHEAVIGFRETGGRLRGVETKRGLIETPTCIVATGAWAGEQLRSTGLDLSIEPVRGQMIVIKAAPGYLRHMLVYDYRYLIPRRDGRILVGSTVERVGYDKSATPQVRDLLCSVAVSLVPGLADLAVEHHWAGLRPGTPDDLPFIGEHPGITGLFVCAGHHRNGFATGPASAQLVVDLLLGRKPAIDPTPYRLDRPITPWSA